MKNWHKMRIRCPSLPNHLLSDKVEFHPHTLHRTLITWQEFLKSCSAVMCGKALFSCQRIDSVPELLLKQNLTWLGGEISKGNIWFRPENSLRRRWRTGPSLMIYFFSLKQNFEKVKLLIRRTTTFCRK